MTTITIDIDPGFIGAGQVPGYELWRIEALKAVKLPKVDGKFYVGDSYILLSTITSKGGNSLPRTIHFWIGLESSDDEAGCAAYKSVELSDIFHGLPQHREIQGNESKLFQSYFKTNGGIQYLPGGIASGFKHIERDVYETRLLHCKGSRTVRVTEVPLSKSSLNKGDVFVLDAGLIIYIFNGSNSNRRERAKGIEVATRIRNDERGGRSHIVLLDDEPQEEGFWDPLGGYSDPDSLPAGVDDSTVAEVKMNTKLFAIDHEGQLALVMEIPSPKEKINLRKDLLVTTEVYMLHSSTGKIFIWVGHRAAPNKKREATADVTKYIKAQGIPSSTQIERVAEGVESSAFKSEFGKWDVILNTKRGIAEAKSDTDIDVQALLARKAAEEAPPDDGSGKVEIWVIQDMEPTPLPNSKYGNFYGGDSYIVKYSFKRKNKEETIYYFWQGDTSSMDEKTCSAWHAKEMAHKTTGKVAQVRVMQGKEPAHFSMIFKGMMIIHKGGHSSALKQVAPSARTDSTGSAGGGMSDMASLNMLRQGGVSKKSDGSALFRVHGTTTVNTRTVEVTKKALELNSDDCFIAINDSSLFVWCGRGSNPTERKAAQIVSDVLSHNYHSVSTKRKFEVIEEGKEPAEFWTLLGGKGMYPESGPGAPLPKDPLLFVCSDSSGSFKVEEVPQFTQSDLNDEDVFLLDTFCTIFVWLGSQSNQHEKDKSLNTAKLFATQCNDGRDPNCPIVIVDAGTEPSMFTTHFVPWDEQMSERNKFVDPYEEKLRAIRRRSFPTDINGVATSLQEASVSNDSEPIVYITGYFPFKDVKAGSIPGMNLQARETYLDDETFKEKLGVDRDTFNAMPRWKRDQKKKDIGIF